MNYKSLANKGRYGDSELRNVAGRTSHVNSREADIIDLWGALGESLVQREGAGTRNPMTGMPEYHRSSWLHNSAHNNGLVSQEHEDETARNAALKEAQDSFDPSSAQFRAMVEETGDYSQLIKRYGFEQEDTKFFDQPNLDELGFIDEQFDIDTARIGEDLRSASLQASRNLAGSRQQGDIARSRSNMATSGTINAQQRATDKGIWQDYTQQQKTLSSQMTDADLTKRRGVSGFWSDLESDFYTTAGNLE